MGSNNFKHILFISRFYIHVNNDGSSAYILDLMKYLKENSFDITYVLLPQIKINKYPWYKIPKSVSELMSVETNSFIRVGNYLIAKIIILEWIPILIWLVYMQSPLRFKKFYRKLRTSLNHWFNEKSKLFKKSNVEIRTLDISPNEKLYINKLMNKYSPSAVIVDFASLAGIFDAITDSSNIKKILLTHDVLFKRARDFSQAGVLIDDLERGWTYELESFALQKADVVIAIQKEEANLFKSMSPTNQIITVPMAATLKKNIHKQISGRCLFVGSGADQNIVCINWFLYEVWGEVLQQNPNASFHVCGTVCDSISKFASNTKLLGRIDNLNQEYDEAEVVVVPLIAGTGLKIKLIEALSYGRVVVSTHVGVQGIYELENSGIIVADKHQDFASAIIEIQRSPDLRQSMEKKARNFITKYFSKEICYQPLMDSINFQSTKRKNIDT